jgi:hypothetical protein
MSDELHPAIEGALTAAVDGLCRAQGADGAWHDWALPPGTATAWPTAYIGARLAAVPATLATRATQAQSAAAGWLAAAQAVDGGWSYNATVASDADSTGQAIVFLAAAGIRVNEAAYRCLLAFQREDGGFATYRCGDAWGSWTVSHPDVSAVAVCALLTRYGVDHPAVARALTYIKHQRRTDGLWNAFWWRGPLYATAASLAALAAAGVDAAHATIHESLLRMDPDNAFDAALYLEIAARLDLDFRQPPIRRNIAGLLATQQTDGRWPPARVLRLTRSDCHSPWDSDDSGSLYADPAGLFTTATAVGALAIAAAHLECRHLVAAIP